MVFVHNITRCSDRKNLVLLYNGLDRADRAWAVKGTEWRDLGLVAKHPNANSFEPLYPGSRLA